jgi:hypothetical protein
MSIDKRRLVQVRISIWQMKTKIFVLLACFALSPTLCADEFDRHINDAVTKFKCSKKTPCDFKVTKDDEFVWIALTKAHIDRNGLLVYVPGDHNTFQYTLRGKFVRVIRGE